MKEEHWQLQLVNKSLKKKEKLSLLEKYLKVKSDAVVLDLGCAQGILSYFLRKKGGFWVSADLDLVNLQTSQAILENNLVQTGTGVLPFKDDAFDQVVSLDYLEHMEDDNLCLSEICRILKPGGELLVAVPRTGHLFMLHRLRPFLGMKLEFYGHKREGYSLSSLREKLSQARLVYIEHKSFSRFFAEFIELMLNFFYIRFFSAGHSAELRDGHIRPTTADEFRSRKKAFKAYSVIYPFVWLITRVDKLFFFQRGYGLMVWAKKSLGDKE